MKKMALRKSDNSVLYDRRYNKNIIVIYSNLESRFTMTLSRSVTFRENNWEYINESNMKRTSLICTNTYFEFSFDLSDRTFIILVPNPFVTFKLIIRRTKRSILIKNIGVVKKPARQPHTKIVRFMIPGLRIRIA